MTITKPKIAIFSDLHLGKHSNSADWHKIAFDWADWFIEDLQARKIKDVIFAGDWHDNRSEISVHTLDVSAKLIEKFKDFNLHLLVGNHDIPYKHSTAVSSVSIYANKPNVRVYDKLSYLEAFDRKIALAPWASDMNQLDQVDVTIGHLEIESFKMGAVRVCEKGWRVLDLIKKSKLTFSGHFHIKSSKEYKEGTIIYTGNPFQMDFGDYGDDKGYYILNLDDLSYQFIENPVSPIHIKVKLSDIEKNGLAHYDIGFTRNILRLEVDVEMESKKLLKLFDQISALRPLAFTTDYTYIAQRTSGDVKVEDDISSIDIKKSITDYLESVELYGKDKVESYLLEAYDKTR